MPVEKRPSCEPGAVAFSKDFRQLLDQLLSRLIKEVLRKPGELIFLVF